MSDNLPVPLTLVMPERLMGPDSVLGNHLSDPVGVNIAKYVFHLVAIVPSSDSLHL